MTRWTTSAAFLAPLIVILPVLVLQAYGVRAPNLSVFLLVTVAYSVLAGTRSAWVVSSLLAFVFYAGYELFPGGVPDLTWANAERVVSTSVGLLITVGGLSQLKVRLRRALENEREARAAAEHGQARIAHLLERVTDAFFALDREWRYTYVNRNAELMVGKPREELLGRIVWEAFPPLRGTAFEREYERALEEGVSVHFEAYYAPFQTWYETHAYPSQEGLTIFLRPINDRKEAEAALQTRARQQAAVAKVGMRSLVAEDEAAFLDEVVHMVAETLGVELTKVLELAPAGDRLLLRAGAGWGDGVVGCTFVSASSSSQAGYTLDTLGPVVTEDVSREKRFTAPDLLIGHGVVAGLSVVIGSGGRPYGVLGAHTRAKRAFSQDDANFLQAIANVVAEFVERNRRDEALREAELRFRQLAENLDEVLFIEDPAGTTFYYISPAYEHVWGRSCQSLYDAPQSWLDAVHTEDRARARATLKDRAERPAEVEYRIVRADGQVRWIRAQTFPVSAKGGRIERVVGIAEDITERKQSEEQTRLRLQAEAAQLNAEAALQAREEVLAFVSHDLRTPIGTIHLCARALESDGSVSEQGRELVARIDRSVVQMERLVADLLDFGLIQAGHLSLNEQEVPLSELFSDICDTFRPQADARGLKFDAASPELGARILVDRERMIQALSNLIGNALKFTKQGSITLRGACHGDEVHLCVQDTGPGIAPDAVQQIFDRYWREKDDYRGLGVGLGLSIAKGIVEAHGGHIWVESQLGVGTTFHASLPSRVAKPAARA